MESVPIYILGKKGYTNAERMLAEDGRGCCAEEAEGFMDEIRRLRMTFRLRPVRV